MSMTFTRRGFLHSAGALAAGGALMAGPLRAGTAWAATGPAIGQPAPAFTVTNVDGASVNLADYKGKLVVLEWTNHGCPFVRKHYDSGNMQALQKEATDQDIVWLAVISSAPGEQGHLSPADAKARMQEERWAASTILLDPEGTMGRAYDAKTTPHMYIIGTDGTLLYNGAIDDKPTAKQEDIKGARNHVREALAEIRAGKPVSMASTKPYGCNVKYSKTTT
ncbi:thioredoxin family protein [Niveispirillum fermenti]|uniref:thioredoxin family protein n=1 Tax=Niveispirillum fermenti TaxID=1233113 RepID=UPI003A865638